MKKVISALFSILSIVLISACSSQSNKTLDGEYYWISEGRNERVFTISGNKGTIDSGEADNFDVDQKNETIELSGSQIVNRIESYTFKDGVFTVDISGTKHDYYLKGSEAYNKALKKYGYDQKGFTTENLDEQYENLYDFIKNLEILIQKNAFDNQRIEEISIFDKEVINLCKLNKFNVNSNDL